MLLLRKNQPLSNPHIEQFPLQLRQILGIDKPLPRASSISQWDAFIFRRAAAQGDINSIIKLLLSTQLNVDSTIANGITALHHAASFGQLAEVVLLLHAGAAINAQNINQWTALHFASAAGYLPIVMFLVTAGIDIERQTNNGDTALHFAAQCGHVEIVAYLLNARAQLRQNKQISNSRDTRSASFKLLGGYYGQKYPPNP